MTNARHRVLWNRQLIPLLVAALLAPVSALAESGLAEIYAQALANDPTYAAAVAGRDSSQELPVQARADLLPSIFARAQAGREHNQIDGRDYNYNPFTLNLTASVPIVRLDKLALYRGAEKRSEYGQTQLNAAGQDLLLKVAEGYFNTLLAIDTITLTRAQKDAIAEQRKQTENLYASGVGTITEVNEAQARYELAEAQELQALNSLEQRRRELRRLTGNDHTELRPLSDNFPIAEASPNDIQEWYRIAYENNPALKGRRALTEVSDFELKSRRAEHYPSLDLQLSHTRSSEPSYSFNSQETSAATLQLNVPIFLGMRTTSRVAQGLADLQRASKEEEAAQRDIEVQVNKAFLDIQNSIARIRALESAVKSSELSLKGTRIGQEYGQRTNVDVLNAQQQLYSTRRDLQQERYRYIISQFHLKGSAGIVTVEDIQRTETWLGGEPASAMPAEPQAVEAAPADAQTETEAPATDDASAATDASAEITPLQDAEPAPAETPAADAPL